MRNLDGAALVLAVLLSLLLIYSAGIYIATAAEIQTVPAPSRERRDAAVAQRESRGEPVAALLILLLKEGRGTR